MYLALVGDDGPWLDALVEELENHGATAVRSGQELPSNCEV